MSLNPNPDSHRFAAVNLAKDQQCIPTDAARHPLNAYHAALLCPEHQPVADTGRVAVRWFAMREDIRRTVNGTDRMRRMRQTD